MRDVKLVRLSDDGTHVVLTHEGTGEEFALRIDDRLRGFVTSDRARVAQLPVERPSRLAPKEIQARLRAGESSEDIAAAADVSLERVMRYAGPVLAEREYLAEQAQTALLRRPPGGTQNGGPSRALGSTVTERLEALGTSTSQVRWDAWRMPDGRWAVAVFYHLPGTTEEARAMFGFDPVGRTVVPIDDAGEWILGERPAVQQPTTVEGPAPRTPRDARPRLTAVPAPPDPVAPAAPTGRDEDSVVRTLRPAPAPNSAPPPAPAAPATPPASTGERGAPPVTGESSEHEADDRIAYEPTVDLSRSIHDQPQPAPEHTSAPAKPVSTEPASADTGPSSEAQWTVRRPAAPPPLEPPEPPRLSTADLPDLGESTRTVPSATATATPAPPPTAEPANERPSVAPPAPAPTVEAPSRVPADPPVPAAPERPAAQSPVAEADSGPSEPAVSGEPVPVPAPVPTEPRAPSPVRSEPATAHQPVAEENGTVQAEPQRSRPELADQSPATDPTPPTDPAQVGEPEPQPRSGKSGAASAGRGSGKQRAAGKSVARQGSTEKDSDADKAAENGEDDADGAAAKKSLGQDRRTSNNRRRRASGSRRKGSVPSWDDILFGGGSGRKD